MYFGAQNLYIPPKGMDDLIASLDHSVRNRAHVVSQVPRICTLLGPAGSGKTALMEQWRATASCVVRSHEVVHIWLSPPSDEYRSMSHMVLARILDTLDIMFAPAYTPVRSRADEADSAERFGKKQLEALRKKVDRKLAERPIRAIVVDDIHHIDKHALVDEVKAHLKWLDS
jgi:ATP/maltotriose-dependent transcriptional regulator MalT